MNSWPFFSSTQKLCDLEDAAKSAGIGKHGPRPEVDKHVRDIKWTIDNPRNFVDSLHNKPVKAVIEHVRDGCTVRAFLNIDDIFYHVTVMMSGIRVSCDYFSFNLTIMCFCMEVNYGQCERYWKNWNNYVEMVVRNSETRY